MDIFPLAIFPQGSLASSVITTVWVGVMVVAFFNLRLGWTLSGLVVPGYIVPLLLVKPWAAAAVFVESVVTYLVVWWLSEVLPRYGYWSSLFGRDRFFALVLVSVMVRILFDGWLLPGFGEWINASLGVAFDYRNNFHSFGLIIVALMANLYWKPGLARGVIPLFVTVGLTLLIVRFGLMEWTNFTISNLSYMYEDIAASILASPKAYIILLTAAFLASRMNLLYGWDFSGILIPSLLALQWYQPEKIFTSFVEAVFILIVARLLLRLPLLRHRHIEGARQLMLFFNIGFVYKLALGYLVVWLVPEVKVTDTYGFGYLLGTLIALKMHEKDIPARMTRATLQTSFVGMAAASLVGFGLSTVPFTDTVEVAATAEAPAVVRELPDVRLVDQIRQDKVLLHQYQQRQRVPMPLTQELESFSDALTELEHYGVRGDAAALVRAIALLAGLRYEIYRIEDRYLYLKEMQPARGWGIYVLDTTSQSPLVVEVPAPPGIDLLNLINHSDTALLIDAAVSDFPPGTITRLEDDDIDTVLNNTSTHDFGVLETIALGKALNQLPQRVIVLGITIGQENIVQNDFGQKKLLLSEAHMNHFVNLVIEELEGLVPKEMVCDT